MATSEAEVAAKLIERLLADPAFRARFRRDPAAACREAGLEQLAQEMSVGGGKAMHTLDLRESKSSLAGVMMAAAMEGVGIYQFSENLLPHLEEIPGQVADVLSRVDLPALPKLGGGGAFKGTGSPAGAVAPPVGPDGLPTDAADAGAAPPAAPPPAAPPAAPAAPPPEAPKLPEPKAAADTPSEPSAAEAAAKKIAEENSPEAAQKAAQEDAANAL